jgi:Na+-driven multidrug efflux pump
MEVPIPEQTDAYKMDKRSSLSTHIAMIFILFVVLSIIGFSSFISLAANEEGTGSNGFMGAIGAYIWKTLYFPVWLLLKYYKFTDVQFVIGFVLAQIIQACLVYYIILRLKGYKKKKLNLK